MTPISICIAGFAESWPMTPICSREAIGTALRMCIASLITCFPRTTQIGSEFT